MPCDNTIEMVENDLLPNLVCTFTGVDLTGYGPITLHVKYSPALGGALIKTAIVIDAANGKFQITWNSGDLKAGHWPAEIQLINALGKPLTFRGFSFTIYPEIA